MKFRCEREALVEALSTAGRAATGRSGALPVLSGIRLELVGDRLTVTGTDLDLTIQLTTEVGGERDGGADEEVVHHEVGGRGGHDGDAPSPTAVADGAEAEKPKRTRKKKDADA